jgi:hypothetical protein
MDNLLAELANLKLSHKDNLLAELAKLKLSFSESQPRHRPGQQQYGAGAGAGPPGSRLSPFTSILPSIISHTHGRERRSVQHAPGHSFILQGTRHPQIRPLARLISASAVQCIIPERSVR